MTTDAVYDTPTKNRAKTADAVLPARSISSVRPKTTDKMRYLEESISNLRLISETLTCSPQQQQNRAERRKNPPWPRDTVRIATRSGWNLPVV